MSTTYSPAGHGCVVLGRLEQHGSQPMGDLADWATTTGADDRKHRAVMGALLRDGFVTCPGGIYAITTSGLGLLVKLRAGEAVTVDPEAKPGVRVFERAVG